MLVFAVGGFAKAAAPPPADDTPTPQGKCGPGSRPEATQGRVPAADYASGRAAEGYMCNTEQVAHFGTSGGYRTYQYADPAGHKCAYYDTTLLFPTNVVTAGGNPTGVWALHMSDPAKPVRTDTLWTPAMPSPHQPLCP